MASKKPLLNHANTTSMIDQAEVVGATVIDAGASVLSSLQKQCTVEYSTADDEAVQDGRARGGRFLSPVDVLPDIMEVVTAVQKVQHNDLAACSMLHGNYFLRGSHNVRIFTDEFMKRLTGTKHTYHCWLHKSRLIKTLQAVEHVYSIMGDEDTVADLIGSMMFVQPHFYAIDKTAQTMPEGISTVAKLMKVLAWMTITSLPLHTTTKPLLSKGTAWHRAWAKLLTLPPTPTMKRKFGDGYNAGRRELEKANIDINTTEDVEFDPVNISPEWFSLENPCETYCKYSVKDFTKLKKEEKTQYEIRVISEYKLFLSSIIAALKAELDIVSLVQTKMLGVMASVAFAGIQFAMGYLTGSHQAGGEDP